MEEKNNIVIYQLEDGKTKIDVKLEDETVWLSQQQMAELFDTSRTNVIEHINNIYLEEELDKNSTFRKWATERLKEYMIKGFTMDDERLKGNGGGNNC